MNNTIKAALIALTMLGSASSAFAATRSAGTAMGPSIHDRWYQDVETPYQGFGPNSTKGNWAFWDNMNGETMAH